MRTEPREIAERRAERVIARASFGPDGEAGDPPKDADSWLAQQLHPDQIDDSALDARLAGNADLAMPGMLPRRGEGTDARQRKEFKRQMRRLAMALSGQRIVRAVHARRQLEEVMLDFWFNHFNVFARKSAIAMTLPEYEDTLRKHVLGRFEELLVASAQSPAMLIYLDNYRSSRERSTRHRGGNPKFNGINENYARELLELHTLGVRGEYTQTDVIEVARTLTGWSVKRSSGTRAGSRREFAFRAFLHDDGPKRVLGKRVPGAGQEQGIWLLRMLARHPSTAHHIATKLCRRFVADDPPEPLVARVSGVFLATAGDIRPMLRCIFDSPEFVAPENRKLKTPLEFVASAARRIGAQTDGGKAMLFVLRQLGEPPLHCSAPTGYPDRIDAWLDPGAMLERISFAYGLAADKIEGTRSPHGRTEIAKLALELASPEFQWQ